MELIDNELRLRRFEPNDASRLVELCNNRKLWERLTDYFPHPYSEKDARLFIESCMAEDPPETFAIELDSILIGSVGLKSHKGIYRFTAEIGYWLGEPYWGKGYATRAVKLLTAWGLEKMGFLRIQASVFDFNKISQRVLEKAGYNLECIARKAAIKNEHICDEYRYAHIKQQKIAIG